jgi:predicted Zn-dependent peptidase
MQILPRFNPLPKASPQADFAPLLPGLAPPQSQLLANGAQVVSLQMPEAPLVCLDFWCRGGSLFERSEESGIAHFLEHMVFKGSRSLAAGEFDLRIEALGGSSNAATGFDDVHYHVLIPPEAAPEALELLLDLVLAPALDPEAFAMERQVVLEELAQSEDQPDDRALQVLLGHACGGHNYGLPILGLRPRLLAHTPEAMASFQQRRYRADHCVLAITGALEAAGLERALKGSALARLEPAVAGEQMPALRLQPGEHRIRLPRLEAARLLMAWQMPAASDQEGVMGADLLTTVLAEGRRSRLVERLREQLRIVESIDLDLHVMECASLALLEVVCDAAELPEVRQAIHAVWQEAMAAPIGAAEWQRGQRLVTNGYRFGLEAPGGVAGLIGNNHLWGRDHDLARPLELLAAWSPERLQLQALPLLDPRRACILEALPA